MSISSSLFSGVSGLTSYGYAMSVIGDNIANVNTIGFKGSSTAFEDILSQSIATSSGTSQVGRGVTLSNITASFDQGSFESTSEATDLAIGGKGFFMVTDADTGITYYTRSGVFRLDENGYLVNPSGLTVQGWVAEENSDGTVSTVGAIQDIVIDSTSSEPQATSLVSMAVNLSSDSNETAYNSGDFLSNFSTTDGADADYYNYSTTLTVYDSLGSSHVITIYFQKVDNGGASTETEWEWYAVTDPANSENGSYDIQAQGTLTFNSDGVLICEEIDLSQCLFDFSGGAELNQTVDFQFGTQAGAVTESTQYSSASTTMYQAQDGYGSGFLESISVDTEGVIAGHYSNGQIIYLYQIALANFQNPWGLDKEGGSLYAESKSSGQPLTGIAGTNGLGSISSNSLEQSNVDIATEFVKMIITQRAFQANSRVITSTDEMMAELINLKR
ncbi:MAG: flagellar hook protein FlgE [Thermodesulfobacteriota bacterium]|nr:flagellar hook protein FlgE [Thermodesulfobacteriota bacterium]